MSSGNDIDPHESPRALFAFELRQYRRDANLSQKELARRIGFSSSMVAMIESMSRPPSQRFAELCDQVFGLDGTMARLYVATTWNKAPEHFRPWLEEEEDATALRSWDPLLIPGLLQTEAYARAIFEDEPGITRDEVDQRVGARMRRRTLLSRDDSPMVWVIIEEGTLRRPIGGPEVLGEQLSYLLEVTQHPRVTIQVVPYGARAACGLMGAFSIAERRGMPVALYIEAQPQGHTTDDRKMIATLLGRYDAIRAEALSPTLSLKLIREVIANGSSWSSVAQE
jgi:transcriptional regulator with XRE-family HTH domain